MIVNYYLIKLIYIIMKTLSSAEYKRHDAITFLLFILLMAIIAITAITHTSCSTIKSYDDMSAVQKSWFDACIENHPDDTTCDSCFSAIVKKSR
jgi:hypothetical protein